MTPGQEDPRQYVGESFEDDNGLVLEKVREEEDQDQDRQIRVSPDRIDIVVHLCCRHACPVTASKESIDLNINFSFYFFY